MAETTTTTRRFFLRSAAVVSAVVPLPAFATPATANPVLLDLEKSILVAEAALEATSGVQSIAESQFFKAKSRLWNPQMPDSVEGENLFRIVKRYEGQRRRYTARIRWLRQVYGVEAAEKADTAACDAQAELFKQAREIPATSLADLMCKARVSRMDMGMADAILDDLFNMQVAS